MCSRPGRPFGKQRDRLVAFERLGDCMRLVPGICPGGALHVDCGVLVCEPVGDAGTELGLPDERTSGSPAEDENVEPGRVIADEQAVLADWRADDANTHSNHPPAGAKEILRPR